MSNLWNLGTQELQELRNPGTTGTFWMSQGSRPDRVADQIRDELASLLARDVHDPGIGFVTLTRVQVSPDIQQARIFYTVLGEEKTRKDSGRALERATPFLRRQIGRRLRLERGPELRVQDDDSTDGP